MQNLGDTFERRDTTVGKNIEHPILLHPTPFYSKVGQRGKNHTVRWSAGIMPTFQRYTLMKDVTTDEGIVSAHVGHGDLKEDEEAKWMIDQVAG